MALLRDAAAPPRTWRHVVVILAVVVVAVTPYALGVLLPYYANDLDQLPLAELTSGAHDPKDLGPQGVVGGLVQLAGLFSLALTPLTLLFVGLASGVAGGRELLARRGGAPDSVPVAVTLLALAVVAVALLTWFTTPLAGALTTWRLD